MRTWKTLLIAAPIAAGLLAAPAAHADWRGHDGWHGDRGSHGGWHGDRDWRGDRGWQRHDDHGGAIAGAVIGLGVGALLGGALAAQQPYYARPPVAYAQPPVAYAPPPAYYSAPTYAVTPGYSGY